MLTPAPLDTRRAAGEHDFCVCKQSQQPIMQYCMALINKRHCCVPGGQIVCCRVQSDHTRAVRTSADVCRHWRGQGGPGGPAPTQWPGRGYFYQMSDMYTCIAYLIEIRKFCSKNLVHKGVNFEAQNGLKLTCEHL